MAAICKACGSIILPGSGVTVVTVESPGQPSRKMVTCDECAERILLRLRERPTSPAMAAADAR